MFNSPGAPMYLRAAHHLTIAIRPDSWALYNGLPQAGAETFRAPLVQITPHQITCASTFAQARQLPRAILSPAEVARVVVGWAPETHTWHLGLLLAAQPETGLKLRWCGLASWPSDLPQAHEQAAHTAGQALAQLIERPLHVIPAPQEPPLAAGDTQPVQGTARLEALAPERPLAVPVIAETPAVVPQAPPFVFEGWELRAVPEGLIWARRGRWLAWMLLRAIGFAALVVLYLVLGIGTQTAGLAAVRPAWLPWLGLGVALVLAGLAVSSVARVLSAADIVIDTAERAVYQRARRGGRVRWRLPFEAIAYVLLTQTPARQHGGRRADGATPITQDVWVHLYDGQRFHLLGALEGITGHSWRWEDVRAQQKTAGRRRLRLEDYDTPAHHAAQALAGALGVDVWLDIRN